MWRKAVSALSLLLVCEAWAGADDVMLDKIWMRESVPGQTSATVQMNLSVTKLARLLSISSPVANSGEIQDVVMHHGKLETQTVDSMKLAAHSTTLFGARGIYLVLVGLKQPLNAGDHVPLKLKMEVGGKPLTIDTEAVVRPLDLSYQHYNDPAVKDHR